MRNFGPDPVVAQGVGVGPGAGSDGTGEVVPGPGEGVGGEESVEGLGGVL